MVVCKNNLLYACFFTKNIDGIYFSVNRDVAHQNK